MSKKYFIVIIILAFFNLTFLFSQSKEERETYLSYYNFKDLKDLKNSFDNRLKTEREKFQKTSIQNQISLRKFKENGTFDEWMGFLPNGTPLYYSIDNIDASFSTRTNHLNSGGSLGLTLNGEGLTVGVWDGGPTRISHIEFIGRAVVGDNAFDLNNNSFHATHVSGTVGATGIDPLAKGMAPNINLRTFDWNNDITEVITEVSNGLLLSNHSYGIRVLSVSDQPWFIGAYSQQARNWDQVAYAAPYYLMVTSAGNDGNAQNPEPSTPGFDKLNGNKNAKNNLVIANARDAEIDENGNLISVNINLGSSQGPSDDGRIKPDVAGNGTNLYSTHSFSDESYLSLSGTSMSGPNVMGTLALLQQYYNQKNGRFMRASTLKGLACHTADDAGLPGPDPSFGWGLLNAKAAANAITNDGLQSWISEEILNNGETFSMTVNANPLQTLKASITWTDVPGAANSGILNDPTPALVNDLDIRISLDNELYYPWKLQSNAALPAIRNQDNNIDNVELVQIDFPEAVPYTITVNHKGTLVNNSQRFSLVITGISNNFAVLVDGETEKTVCSSESATFDFNFITQLPTLVSFNAEQVPNGIDVAFSSESLNTTGSFQMTLSNLENLEGGTYAISVVASNGIETQTRLVNLTVFQENLDPIDIVAPEPYQTGLGSSVNLIWENTPNIENYYIEVATDVLFEEIVFTQNTDNNQITVSNLSEQTIYHWRVFPSNRCEVSSEAPFHSFQTGEFNCNLFFEANDYSGGIIEEVAGATATVPINIPVNFLIGKVNAVVDISHSWVQDMTIYLQRDSENENSVILVNQPCGGQDDIEAVFDDFGNSLNCGEQPAISGSVIPFELLSQFNLQNAQGEWNLFITDSYFQDGGQVNFFGLEFCSTTPLANIPSLDSELIITEVNTTKIINNLEINANTFLQSNSEQSFIITETTSLGILEKNGTPLILGSQFTQQDINDGIISYSNTLSQSATDIFKVDIVNNNNGWLPNQLIEIEIQNTLSSSISDVDNLTLFPNPTKGVFYVKGLENEKIEINVFDLQGRKIITILVNNNEPISLQGLQDGVYLIQLSHDNIIRTKKIVLKRY